MRTIWHSLAWKEWHEHKWKLAAISAILAGVTAIVLFGSNRDRERETEAIAPLMAMLCLVPLTVYVAVGDATGERSRRTLPFLQSLPVPRSTIALYKLGLGIFTCLAPIVVVVVATVAWHWSGDRERMLQLPWEGMRGTGVNVAVWCLGVIILIGVIVSSLFLWSAAVSVNRKDEVSGAAVALATIVVLWVAVTLTLNLVQPEERWWTIVSSVLPGGITAVLTGPGRQQAGWVLPIGLASIVHAALLWIFIQRFGGRAEVDRFSSKTIDVGEPVWFLASPRRSPFTAIIWKQLREIGPPLAAGFAAIACWVASCLIIDRNFYTVAYSVAHLVEVIVRFVGFVVAMTVGIGLMLNDLSPQLNAFWRSRPINPDLWFWTKYCTVPVAFLTVLGAPLLVAWIRLRILDPSNSQPLDATGALFLLAAVYAVAVATTCLLRQAIYAAVLTIAGLLAPYLVLWLLWLCAAKLGLLGSPALRGSFLDPYHELVFVLTSAATALIATILAWLAVRNDWGRKN